MKPLALLVGFAMAAAVFASPGTSLGGATTGEALFVGEQALAGTIRGHRSSLPPEAVRCVNCHAVGEKPMSAQGVTHRLGRSLLVEKRSRRGGPPSSYDAASFCRLLRTGIDPAFILISRVMPVYEVGDAQCAALWDFLIAPKGSG